jgi:hypothetical protein
MYEWGMEHGLYKLGKFAYRLNVVIFAFKTDTAQYKDEWKNYVNNLNF